MDGAGSLFFMFVCRCGTGGAAARLPCNDAALWLAESVLGLYPESRSLKRLFDLLYLPVVPGFKRKRQKT